MDLDRHLSLLKSKDTKEAYDSLKFLESLSDKDIILYSRCNLFFEMVNSETYVIRVRGFRLLCRQAKWDKDDIIDLLLPKCLFILNDDKPTAVRQALAALHYVVEYKPQLREFIWEQISTVDILKYNEDTMRPLIEKDIANLQKLIIKKNEGER
jgi:hypothetical protein